MTRAGVPTGTFAVSGNCVAPNALIAAAKVALVVALMTLAPAAHAGVSVDDGYGSDGLPQ